MAEKLMTPGATPDAETSKTPQDPAGRTAKPRAQQAPAAPPTEPAEAEEGEFFMVEEDIEVPSRGGKYLLRKGKTISAKSYDVEELRNIGAKLKPAKQPAWHRHLHATGRSQAV